MTLKKDNRADLEGNFISLAYVFFLLSGTIKSYLVFFGLNPPVDITAISMIVVFLGIVSYNFSSRVKLTYTKMFFAFSLLIFLSYLGLSLAYSPSNTYKFVKFFQFGTVVFAALVPILYQRLNLSLFIRSYSYTSLILAFIYVTIISLLGFGGTEKSLHDFSTLYLFISFSLGISALLFFFSKSQLSNAERNIFFSLSVITMLFLGARAPLIFLLFSILVVKASQIVHLGPKQYAKLFFWVGTGSLASLIGLPILYLKSEAFNRTLTRLFLLVSDVSGTNTSSSVSVRLENMLFALESTLSSWSNLFFGNGVGSFGVLAEGVDEKRHPHNILLEIWFDVGFTGVLLFLIIILFPVIISYKRKSLKLIPGAVLLFILMNYMKSSSYSEIRIGMSLLAMFICFQYLPQENILSTDSAPSAKE